MGATALDRIFKRRINEMEEDIKRLQRQLQKLKQMAKVQSRSRKEIERAIEREGDLREVMEDLEAETFHDLQSPNKTGYDSNQDSKSETLCCRREGCGSKNVDQISAGPRTIVVCGDCGSRHTVQSRHGLSFAKTG